MATKSITDVLSRDVAYSGEGISVRSLEDSIHQERTMQDSKVSELKNLRERNVEIQSAMTEELHKLRKFSDYLDGTATNAGFWAGFKEVLSYIPGLKSIAISNVSSSTDVAAVNWLDVVNSLRSPVLMFRSRGNGTLRSSCAPSGSRNVN